MRQNMNNRVILDASALLALIQEETGAEIIKPLLKFSVMSVVNVTETLSVLQRITANKYYPRRRTRSNCGYCYNHCSF